MYFLEKNYNEVVFPKTLCVYFIRSTCIVTLKVVGCVHDNVYVTLLFPFHEFITTLVSITLKVNVLNNTM